MWSPSLDSHLSVMSQIADAALEFLAADSCGVAGGGIPATHLEGSVHIEEDVLSARQPTCFTSSPVLSLSLSVVRRQTVIHCQCHKLQQRNIHSI